MAEKEQYDNEYDDSIEYGVMRDKLDNGRFVFWSLLGIGILVVMILAVSSLYHYNKFLVQESSATQQEFREIKMLKDRANHQLNTAGVKDAENDVYHIPIEDAISIYLNETEN